jgi:hypothetical protein
LPQKSVQDNPIAREFLEHGLAIRQCVETIEAGFLLLADRLNQPEFQPLEQFMKDQYDRLSKAQNDMRNAQYAGQHCDTVKDMKEQRTFIDILLSVPPL